MSFSFVQPVRFAHVDAAGIVFYPRYFEMLNATVEEYFANEIGVTFAEMHVDRRVGTPTISLAATFAAPSRLGDLLTFTITVERVGRSSAELAVLVTCEGSVRFEAKVVLVCMDLVHGTSLEWPADIRPVVHRPDMAVEGP